MIMKIRFELENKLILDFDKKEGSPIFDEDMSYNIPMIINIYAIDDDIFDDECDFDEEENKIEVGYIKFNYFDIELAYAEGVNVFDIFDMTCTEIASIQPYLFDKDGFPSRYAGFNANIIYIDRLFINKEFRNQGIGGMILKNIYSIIRYMAKLDVGCVALLANPFEENSDTTIDDKDQIEKLIKFYEKCGFERIEETQYMFKDLDHNA